MLPLNKALTLLSPKKYQPTMVEKAKNSRQMATNLIPKAPRPVEKAFWVRAIPVVVPSRAPVTKMTRAVMLSTTKVSMKTPTIATAP